MKKPWYRKHPDQLVALARAIERAYPDLKLVDEHSRVVFRGEFPIEHNGQTLDSFTVEVELPTDSPDGLPTLRETAGRIPRIEHRHINPDGSACPFVPDERWRVHPPGSTLLDYLRGPAHNYFLGQALVEMGNPWPAGERPHGPAGVLEHYGELLGTADQKTIIRYLNVLAKFQFKGHEECPCGGGRRIRHCHLELLRALRAKISPKIARAAIDYMRCKPS